MLEFLRDAIIECHLFIFINSRKSLAEQLKFPFTFSQIFSFQFSLLNLQHYVLMQIFVSGATTPIKHLSLRSLLPDTEHFMTYEGSTTHPGCWETTVWIILNKPIYITHQEVSNVKSRTSFALLSFPLLDLAGEEQTKRPVIRFWFMSSIQMQNQN